MSATTKPPRRPTPAAVAPAPRASAPDLTPAERRLLADFREMDEIRKEEILFIAARYVAQRPRRAAPSLRLVRSGDGADNELS